MLLDGNIQIKESGKDNYTEDMTREVVLPNSNYKNVLIIGGGDLLIAGYILEKFPFVEKVVVCELDERVVRVTEKYFGLPRNIDQAVKDKRLEIVFEEGSKFIG